MYMEASLLKVVGNTLSFLGKDYVCAVGKNGFAADKNAKREGDGKTPIGSFFLRECWYRADKMAAPKTSLPLKIIHENDGWCDDPASPDYNKHILLPYHFSHEKLWREDNIYDLIIPIGYNDEAVESGNGSAIFMHIAKPDYTGTEGCVALAKNDLLEILPYLSPDVQIDIE